MKKIIFIVIFICICLFGFLSSGRLLKRIFKDPKEIVALSELTKEEIPVMLINENRDNISNIKYYEELDSIDFENGNRVGYLMEFGYLEEDIPYYCSIAYRPKKVIDGGLTDYQEIEYGDYIIYSKTYIKDAKGTAYSNECVVIFEDHVFIISCNINKKDCTNIDLIAKNLEEISLEYTYELIDNYNIHLQNNQ